MRLALLSLQPLLVRDLQSDPARDLGQAGVNLAQSTLHVLAGNDLLPSLHQELMRDSARDVKGGPEAEANSVDVRDHGLGVRREVLRERGLVDRSSKWIAG